MILVFMCIVLADVADAATYYVSKTATNGYVVGNDGNAGTAKGTAKLTIANAISTASATDTIIINDGTYSGTELGASGYIILSKGLTLQAENTGLAVLRTSVVTGLVRLQGPAASTYNLRGLVLDGLGSSTMPNYTLWAEDTTALYTVNVTDCTFTDAVFYFINITANELALTITNVSFSGSSGVRSLLFATALAQGSVTINGAAGTITNHNVATNGLVNIKATAGGVTASVTGVVATMTLDPTLTSTGEHFGIQIVNVANAVIRNNTVKVFGNPGSRTSAIYRITADGAVSAANGIISNNIGENYTNGGYLAIIGADATSAGDNQTNNGSIIGNTLTGSNPTTHGAMLGFNRGGLVSRNTIMNAGYGVLSKQQTVSGGVGPSLFVGNVIVNPQTNGLRCKGSDGTILANNTVYSASSVPTYGVLIDNDGAINCTNVKLHNNTVSMIGGVSIFAQVTTGSGATISNNHWYTTASLPSNAWVYTSTNYGSLSAWEGAAAVTSEISGDPQFTAADSNLFSTKYGSPLRRAGVFYHGCVDVRGRICNSPPDIGAYQASTGDGAGVR